MSAKSEEADNTIVQASAWNSSGRRVSGQIRGGQTLVNAAKEPQVFALALKATALADIRIVAKGVRPDMPAHDRSAEESPGKEKQ